MKASIYAAAVLFILGCASASKQKAAVSEATGPSQHSSLPISVASISAEQATKTAQAHYGICGFLEGPIDAGSTWRFIPKVGYSGDPHPAIVIDKATGKILEDEFYKK